MANADRVYVASPALAALHAEQAAQFLSNRLDPRVWRGGLEPPSLPATGSPVRIVYLGTPTHDADFKPVKVALDQVWAQRPGTFNVTFLGAVRELPEAPWVDLSGVRVPQTAYPDFCQRALSCGAFHIGLAPLENTSKNNAKSDLRCLDNAALGAVTLASNAPAYSDVIDRGIAIGVTHDAAGWQSALIQVLDAPDMVRAMAKAARTWLWDERSVEVRGGLDDHLFRLLDEGLES
jgi:hypothetical protein